MTINITAAFREGCDDATSEIRCGAFTRETAKAWLAATTRDTRTGERADYSRGYDATIQAFADGCFDLGSIFVAARARAGAL